MPLTQHLTLSDPQPLLPLSPQCHSNKYQLSKMPPLNAVVSLTTLCLLLSPLSLGTRSFPPEPHTHIFTLPRFAEAPHYRNGIDCPNLDPSFIHIAMTLDSDYLRGTIAAIHSILRHATCPQNITFHFITSESDSVPHRVLTQLVHSTFPSLAFNVHLFCRERAVASLISASVRRALESPLNYARNYLGEILDSVDRVIYLDSDLVLVDDIRKLWHVTLPQSRVIAAPEYCHANFTKYFTNRFWSNPVYSRAFGSRRVCYFNTGVMVMDLKKWREEGYTERLEKWMRVQKSTRIYELGSLPPFLLVFAGEVEGVHHRWNQHGLGGDNVNGLCRDLHHGPVSLLHWSGKGKPWVRLDQNKPCPLDRLWEPYDLFNPPRQQLNTPPWSFSSSLLVGYPHDLL